MEENKKELIRQLLEQIKFTYEPEYFIICNDDGKRYIFCDIKIDESTIPSDEAIIDDKSRNKYNNWNICRGRTANLSLYASLEQSRIMAIQRKHFNDLLLSVYEKYLDDNFNGKVDNDCKMYDISQTGSYFSAYSNKDTSFTKWLKKYNEILSKDMSVNNILEAYQNLNDSELAWAIYCYYLNNFSKTRFINECYRMAKDADYCFNEIKSKKAFLKEAERILHMKFN